jgi:hypothetical protein
MLSWCNWRGVRAVEGAPLERVWALTGPGGSNPPLSVVSPWSMVDSVLPFIT